MTIFDTWLITDLQRPLTVALLPGSLFTGDDRANRINVRVYDGGQAASLAGTVTAYLIRSDDSTLIITGTLAGDTASITLPEAAYICPGPLDIVIKLTGQHTATIGACRAYVTRTSTDTIADPGRVIPSLDELLAMVERLEADMALIEGMSATAHGLGAQQPPTVTVSRADGHYNLDFGIPKGDAGVGGVTSVNGYAPDAQGQVTIPTATDSADGLLSAGDKAKLSDLSYPLSAKNGGTGLTSYAVGDILYASGASALSRLAGNATATRKFLRSVGNGSAAAAPVWDTVTKTDVGLGNVENTKLSTWAGSANITTLGTISSGTWQGTAIAASYIGNHSTDKLTSGTLPIARGGTGLTSYAVGDILYASGASALSRLAGNATATRKFLRSTGSGSAAAAPVWDTLTKSDVGLGNVENTALSTWAGSANITTLGTISSGTWQGTAIAASYIGNHSTDKLTSGTLPIARGGTGLTASPSLLVDLGSTTAANILAASPRPGVTGTLGVAHGGTGASTLASGRALIGNGTDAVQTRAITNITSGAATASTNLITANTLVSHVSDYAPTKTGTGASGTWPISISGNAASATKATQDENGKVIASTYLPLTGGTLSGALTINANITTSGTLRTDHTGLSRAANTIYPIAYVAFKNAAGNTIYTSNWARYIGTDGTDGYNTTICLGSGNGTTWITAGESGGTLPTVLKKYNDEVLYLSADGEIRFYTNCANDGSSYKSCYISNGTFYGNVSGNVTGNVTGNAATATTWQNSRAFTIGNTSLFVNGSGNYSWPNPLKIGYYGSDEPNTRGWYKVMTVSQSGFSDCNLNLLITSSYSRLAVGLLHLHVRCNNGTENNAQALGWMYRYGFAADHAYFKDNGNNTWSLYVYQNNTRYGRVQVQILTETGTEDYQQNINLVNNHTKEASLPTGGVSATDIATTNYSNTAGSAASVGGYTPATIGRWKSVASTASGAWATAVAGAQAGWGEIVISAMRGSTVVLHIYILAAELTSSVRNFTSASLRSMTAGGEYRYRVNAEASLTNITLSPKTALSGDGDYGIENDQGSGYTYTYYYR